MTAVVKRASVIGTRGALAEFAGEDAPTNFGPLLLVVALPIGITGAHAQWTVTSLHPMEVSRSHAHGVYGVQQGGDVEINGVTRASSWNGTVDSDSGNFVGWISLELRKLASHRALLPPFLARTNQDEQIANSK